MAIELKPPLCPFILRLPQYSVKSEAEIHYNHFWQCILTKLYVISI